MSNELKEKKIGSFFSSLIVNHPIKALGLFLLIFLALIPGLAKINSSWSPRIWFSADHPEIKKLDRFEKMFGSDQSVTIAIHNKGGIFNKEQLKIVSEITEKFWTIKGIIRVESMTNYNHISSKLDDILIEPLIDEEREFTIDYLTLAKKKALKDEVIPDYFLSKDTTLAIIYGILKPSFSGEPDYTQIVADTEALILPYQEQFPKLKLFLLGTATANESFRRVSVRDNTRIMPFMFFFIVILLMAMFRSTTAVIIPIVLSGATISAIFGLLGHLGLTYNSMLAAIPGILLAICIADSVHILVAYFHYINEGHKSKKAIAYSLTKNFQPTLLTSISTTISFFSITLTDILPIKDLGKLSGAGTLLAWVFSYLLIGGTLSLLSNYMDKKRAKKSLNKNKKIKSRFTSAPAIISWIDKYKTFIIIFFILQFFGSLYLATQNEVNSDPMKYFADNVPIKKGYNFASKKMDGLRGIDLVVDSGKKDGIKNPDFLNRLDQYLNWLTKDSDIIKVQSPLTIIKKMHQVINKDNEDFYSIPDNQKTIAEIIFLYTMGLPQGMDLNNQFSLDNRFLRMRVLWKVKTSKESDLKTSLIIEKAKDFSIIVDSGGNVPLYTQMNAQVVSSFFKSMTMAIILVSTLLLFVFKDLFLSLLAILPNLIPLTVGASIMTIFNVYIDIGTSIVTSVCLGVAVDDTIHFINAYKNNKKRGLSTYDALVETYSITGRALIATTTLLVAGFGVFVFADFVPSRYFGVFCSIILFYALVCDLLLLPAILLKFDKSHRDLSKLATVTHTNPVS